MILISLHLYGSGLVLYLSIYLVSVWILEACPVTCLRESN